MHRQLVCDYTSSNKQGKNIACCGLYRKANTNIRKKPGNHSVDTQVQAALRKMKLQIIQN